VQFRVKTTFSGEAPKKSAADCLVSYTFSDVAKVSRCPPLPAFPPYRRIASFNARLTSGGFGKVVAALSKLTII
jgi:hypothetical protein